MLVPSLHSRYLLHHYYELVRLLISLLPHLVYKTLLRHTSLLLAILNLLDLGIYKFSQVCLIYLVNSPSSQTPMEFIISRTNDIINVACCIKEYISFHIYCFNNEAQSLHAFAFRLEHFLVYA